MRSKKTRRIKSFAKSGAKTYLIISILISGSSIGAQDVDSRIVRMLDSIVVNSAITYDIPGISVGIVKNGDVVYLKNHGVENLDTGKPVTSNTVFNMASISKVFTATAIMKLVEKGLVDLNTPAYKYVPYFKMANQNYRKITVEHLLTHKSGLPGDHLGHNGDPYFGNDAIENFIISLYDRNLEFEPGSMQSYSNTGLVLLSAIVEAVTKTKFEDYIQNNIFGPIGMQNSTFDAKKSGIENMSARHVIGTNFQYMVCKEDPDGNRWKTGAGGMSSSVSDMCLFALTLLNKGKIGNTQIISEQSLDIMWEESENSGGLGLIWNVYKWGGKKLVDHGGNSLGVSNELALLPDDSLAVIVFSNNRNGNEWPITSSILKTMLGLDLRKPVYYPDYLTEKKLREERAVAALGYLKETLENDIDEVSCRDMTKLAYRLVQGGEEQNLEVSKDMLELLAEYFPDYSSINEVLGEIYYRLAIKQYNILLKKEPASWTGKKMLELLESIDINFF